MNNLNKISILGTGWLGFPLAKKFLKNGHLLKGSTTSPEKIALLQSTGIEPFVLKLNPELEGNNWAEFLKSDVLIINIPPRVRKQRQASNFHPQQIQNLLKRLENLPHLKIIYISSTSVYPNVDREVTEEETLINQSDAGIAIHQAENLLQTFAPNRLSILRCGGLMGYDRIPGKYFQGKKGLTTGQIPVNFVHQDDVIEIIYELIRQEVWGQIFNVVAPEHPIRQEVYTQNAKEFGFEMPEFIETAPKDYKIVNGNKLIEELRYTYKYPNPLSFRYNQKKTNEKY